MVRTGWTKSEVSEGWTQIVRPRPKIGNDVKRPLDKLAVPRKESVPPDVAGVAARMRLFWSR